MTNKNFYAPLNPEATKHKGFGVLKVLPGFLNRSQNATSSWGGNRYGTFAFTEHGILMLSSVLNSDNAVEVNIQIMRAFVVMRKYAVTYEDLAKRMMELEGNYSDIYEALNHLLKENKMKEEQGYRKRIGY